MKDVRSALAECEGALLPLLRCRWRTVEDTWVKEHARKVHRAVTALAAAVSSRDSRYNRSAKGRARNRRYNTTPAGRARNLRAYDRRLRRLFAEQEEAAPPASASAAGPDIRGRKG